MRSPVEIFHEQQCLTFWFNMYGYSTLSITIYIYNPTYGMKELGKLQHFSANKWYNISYTTPAGEYGIVFEAIKGDASSHSDYSIDDVYISSGSCYNMGLYLNALYNETCDLKYMERKALLLFLTICTLEI